MIILKDSIGKKKNKMEFNELDQRMRQFEKNDDRIVLPEMHIIARIDGRGFTRLTKQVCQFDAPFDEKFRNLMIETVKHLMTACGFNIQYGYTESDEISLLFHRDDKAFGHKARKLLSVLAGEASAAFSASIGVPAAFDCRLCEFPNVQLVTDYFRWRQEDAHRNALNSHCYWLLRKQGKNKNQATEMVAGKTIAQKNELLFQNGINFNDLPAWQKRGVGLYWRKVQKTGYNPVKQTEETTLRNALFVEYELPIGEKYSDFIQNEILSPQTEK